MSMPPLLKANRSRSEPQFAFVLPIKVRDPLPNQPFSARSDVLVVVNDPKATNTFEQPHRVQSGTHEDVGINDGVATISLPPLCVYAGTFRLDR
jgi:hypothetical protein